MIIKDLKYKKFKFNLTPPLITSTKLIKKKDVIILIAQDEFENYLFGEISPLEGFSDEQIEECERKLEKIIIQYPIFGYDEFRIIKEEISQFPSLLFGFEQLILQHQLSREKSIRSEKSILQNALVGIDDIDLSLEKARKFIDNGFRTIKLKIGRKYFIDDLRVIEKFRIEFGSEIKLRLDNNGSWSLNEAIVNIRQLEIFDIEYIEQPVNNLEDLIELASVTNVQIAPDESLIDYESTLKVIESASFNFIVLKPSIRMGIFDSQKIINFAEDRGIKVIITSAYETLVGRSALIYLASLTDHSFPHGLNIQLLGSESVTANYDLSQPLIHFDHDKENEIFKKNFL